MCLKKPIFSRHLLIHEKKKAESIYCTLYLLFFWKKFLYRQMVTESNAFVLASVPELSSNGRKNELLCLLNEKTFSFHKKKKKKKKRCWLKKGADINLKEKQHINNVAIDLFFALLSKSFPMCLDSKFFSLLSKKNGVKTQKMCFFGWFSFF